MVDWDFPNITKKGQKTWKKQPTNLEHKNDNAFFFRLVWVGIFLHLVDEGLFQANEKNRFSELFGEKFLVREDGCKL